MSTFLSVLPIMTESTRRVHRSVEDVHSSMAPDPTFFFIDVRVCTASFFSSVLNHHMPIFVDFFYETLIGD